MRVIVDGELLSESEATVSVFDWGVVRGFGCFEVIRSYGGAPFRLQQHLDRMANSAAALGIEAPPASELGDWVMTAAAAGGDCLVRAYVTAGSRDERFSSPGRTVVFWEPMPDLPDRFRLQPRPAPWHAAGAFSELTQAKSLSYAPNMAASLAAQAAGFDDALLIDRSNIVLEGPTFSVAWFRNGVLHTPELELGVLDSITRRAVLEVAAEGGTKVREGRYRLDELFDADEVVVLSTVKQVSPVIAIGDVTLESGEATTDLADRFAALVKAELSAS